LGILQRSIKVPHGQIVAANHAPKDLEKLCPLLRSM